MAPRRCFNHAGINVKGGFAALRNSRGVDKQVGGIRRCVVARALGFSLRSWTIMFDMDMEPLILKSVELRIIEIWRLTLPD